MLAAILLSITSLALMQDPETSRVVSVIDGNTIKVVRNTDDTCVVVLAGVDSPELTQEYGDQAKSFLERLLTKKEVLITFMGKDRKGNYIAIVVDGDVDPRVELLKRGLAWTAERDPDPELEARRIQAKEKQVGLWKQADPTPPWIYRREQSMMQPKTS